MTYPVQFFASHAALWHVRYSLTNFPQRRDNPYAYLAAGTACILCCSTALEALVNEIFSREKIISPWDELKLASKINVIFESRGMSADWSCAPFQDVHSLIRVRNWLAHHKDPYLGLSNSEGIWIGDKRPKVDVEEVMQEASIRRYYDAVRDAGVAMASLFEDEQTIRWLQNEDYWPLVS